MQLFPDQPDIAIEIRQMGCHNLSDMIPIKGGADNVNSAQPTGQFDPARLIASPLSD